MTALVALLLASMYTGLKPIHDKNEALYNKRAILSAVSDQLGKDIKSMSDADVQAVFDSQITQIAVDSRGNEVSSAQMAEECEGAVKPEEIDMSKEKKKDDSEKILPVYVFENGDEKYYIISVIGNGLWDEIWGNVALKSDMSTIAGIDFDHAAETPGLGAEIKDNKGWKKQYIGKSFYDATGNYTSVVAMKGGVKDPSYQIDGLTGATITANGVNDMMASGYKLYESFLKKQKKS